MKKIILAISILLISIFSTVNAFAGSETYAFHFYFIDSPESVDYNSMTIQQLRNLPLMHNYTVTCDTSSGISFNDYVRARIKSSTANHKYLFIVGKGEGVYGFKDSRGKNISLVELREALGNHLVKSETNPPIDLVVMDADLMANTEVATMLKGYTNYLVAPENVAFEATGLYIDVFNSFYKSNVKSTVTLGKLLCDLYMQKVNLEVGKGRVITTNLSLIDVNMLSSAYESYKTLTKNILKQITKDNYLLSSISKNAKVTVAVGETVAKTKYNLLDFYDFMAKIRGFFPLECANIIKKLEKSIVYKTTSPLMLNAFGASIFFPMYNFEGFEYLLADYNMNIANSDFISSLYNYKYYGSVTDEQKQRLTMAKIGKLKTFNRNAGMNFANIATEIKNNKLDTMVVNLTNDLKLIEQDVKVEVMKRDGALYTYYNYDGLADFTAKGNIKSKFNGYWYHLNNIPMYCQMFTDTYDYTKYSSEVAVNGAHKKFYFAFQSGTPKMSGTQYETRRPENFGAIIKPFSIGDNVTLYAYQNDPVSGIVRKEINTFVYNNNYIMKEALLPDGEYTCRFLFEDLKGELNAGENILFTILNRQVVKVISEKELFKK